ncbi:hypothetical protein [Microbulbifer sp. SAOS-129_SWC]|uniref:hypothetical protein n=1 Tax=Microbulbifer sp. SAOS-129_SWC TaxID=3145235 RepID=UPI0032178CCD
MQDSERIALIIEAVKYCRHVMGLGMPRQCFSKALREPIHFLWEIRHGPKKKVAKYCSVNASQSNGGAGSLVYDHSIPFRYLQNHLLALGEINHDIVRSALEHFTGACLITKAEDQLLQRGGLAYKMPEDWDGADPLARYKAVGIEVVDNEMT